MRVSRDEFNTMSAWLGEWRRLLKDEEQGPNHQLAFKLFTELLAEAVIKERWANLYDDGETLHGDVYNSEKRAREAAVGDGYVMTVRLPD